MLAAVLLALLSRTIAITAWPRHALGPATVRWTLTIAPHADNREACVAYTSADAGERLSCWMMDGERAPRTFTGHWTRLRDGHYLAIGLVRTADGHITRAAQPFQVGADIELDPGKSGA